VEELEQLAALGYVEAPRQFGDEETPDPRRVVRAFNWIDGARELAANGRYDEAIEVLETLAHSRSVRTLVLRTLAPVYDQAGRFDQAAAAYREYIEATGAHEASLGLARTLIRAGKPAEAIAVLESVSPRPIGLEVLRAQALARLGRVEDARAAIDSAFAAQQNSPAHLHAQAALVIDNAPLPDGEARLRAVLAAAPDDPTLKSWLGYYLSVWGTKEQGEEAFTLLRQAADAAADDADVQANLGWGAYRLGRNTEAREALEKVLALDDSRQLDVFRLAVVLREGGEQARALALATRAVRINPAAPWAGEARRVVKEMEEEGPGESSRRLDLRGDE
jgi:tetratricopeptide (TPR) repeat protein